MRTFILSTLFLGVYVILDIILNDLMWDANTKLTVYLQNKEFKGEKEIMTFFSDWLNIFPGIALLVFMFRENKLGAILYGCMIMFIVSLNSLLKNIYHQARPFWTEEDIKGLQCNKEFGKPSGHAMQSSLMCFLLPCILFPAVWRDQENVKYPKVLRVISIAIIIIWTSVTGLSRVFFGAHTFGQVLLGWVYSGYVMINYMTYVHDKLLNYFKTCLATGGPGIGRRTIYISTFVTFIWIMISYLFYRLNRNEILINNGEVEMWLNAMLRKCASQTNPYKFKSASVLQNNCFNNSFQILFIYFLLLGTKLCGGTYDEDKFYQNFAKLRWTLKVYRVVLLLVLLLIVEPFVFFIVTEHLSAVILFQTIPICFFGGFVLTYFYSKSLFYLGLNIQGDFLNAESRVISTKIHANGV
ncbi:unnamed protein product (macronuclear) [Paramecium tetraurelia]|uniref:Phosphatidic acid phosphatase type 2/haloperoxidase domain-containing protein n=1 Tax=Paramecium tetraurelia TaxID=5888 RepID=A0BM36_PARTE|nr:uncharacterized protein GSPATT00030237001 [Paramecium tetraurelia]CAK59603.1 unnamed protein product [Paramecium tetraurelia]|eukprot:XP_001427001.1 hypothetical protein (macronuclear) [Paramecium tetraurelia strain d4-2]